MDSVKLYPLVVRFLHPQHGRIMCLLLTLEECSKASTGENIFKLLDDELQKGRFPGVTISVLQQTMLTSCRVQAKVWLVT